MQMLELRAGLQVTQIRIAGDPTYETRYAFIEFTTVEEVSLTVSTEAFIVYTCGCAVQLDTVASIATVASFYTSP